MDHSVADKACFYPNRAVDSNVDATGINPIPQRHAPDSPNDGSTMGRWRLTGRGFADGLVSAVAALLAYLPTHALVLRQGFWSAITAIAIIQGTLQATKETGRNRIVGAAVGGSVGLCLLLLTGHHLTVYAAGIVLSMTVCGALGIGSAGRLAGVTCTILMLVPSTGSPEQVLLSRVLEVAWGITVAIGTVWLTGWGREIWMKRRARPAASAPSRQDASTH